jgi:hypothetical protein
MTAKPMLLMLERKKVSYFLSPAALTMSQSSLGQLRRDYIGEYLLDQDGALHQIKNIVFLGFYGDSFSRKFLSVLTGTRSIKTELKELGQLSLKELKTWVGSLKRALCLPRTQSGHGAQ